MAVPRGAGGGGQRPGVLVQVQLVRPPREQGLTMISRHREGDCHRDNDGWVEMHEALDILNEDRIGRSGRTRAESRRPSLMCATS